MDDVLIEPAELRHRRAGSAPPTIIDVRSAEEYGAGHLPGAQHLPADDLERRLAEVPTDRSVVTYCSMRHQGSSRSERAAALLREHGYDAAALHGGLPAWQAAGGAVEQGQ